MRIFFIFVFLIPWLACSQIYNDTLFFKSGMERACAVNYFDLKNVNYTYTTKKGDTLINDLKMDQLKYFVVYDSLNVLEFSSKDGLEKVIEEDTLDRYDAPDSMTVKRHMLSVNPLSLAILGLNVSYTYRFGSNKQFGIHVPVRIVSPIITGGFSALYTGVGFTAFIVDKEKYSMTMDITPSFYFFDGGLVLSVPFTFGFVRYIRPKIAIDGRIGTGPGFSTEGGLINFPIPAAHIGIAFLLGDGFRIKTD